MDSLTQFLIPKVPDLLNPVSATYFNEKRAKLFGMSLQELHRTKANEEGWKEVVEPAKVCAGLLKENEGGPYFLGMEVSYADFILVSLLHMMKRLDEGVFERYMKIDEALPRVYEACGEWLERED